jgi:exo-1,4-beta-D-glucosaminidase
MKKTINHLIFLLILTSGILPAVLHSKSISNTLNLKDNWQVISSKDTKSNGEKISTANYEANSWLDAKIPSTVLNVLVENGIYKDILDGLTLQTIPSEQFDVPWWYRTSFNLPKIPKNVQMKINGVNYRADIWINGKIVANKKKIYGPFRQFQLDVTSFLQKGDNVLAMKIAPPKSGDFRIGFTDWNPNPPDKNMGLFRGVQIISNNGLEIKKPFVETNLNTPKNDEAKLKIQFTLQNHQDHNAKALLNLKINDNISIKKKINIAANTKKKIIFSANNYPKLNISSPKLWWPNKMGEPNLYKLKISVRENNILSDKKALKFGIRKIETYNIPYQEKNKKDKSYYRFFKINGQRVLIRGAAWTDSMLLNDTKQNVRAQLKYAKAMNLNAIRLEGFWGRDETIYNTCDELGILIMIGYSAQWEWPLRGFRKKEQCNSKHGCYNTKKDEKIITKSFKDQIIWLRNHPSIFVWMFGSDLKPNAALQNKLANNLTKLSPEVPYVISAAEKYSEKDNMPSGIKMRGPYIYVPPVYWFSNITNGGAFGFNSETGPGALVPPIESLQKMLVNPKNYWPNTNPVWTYHLGAHPLLQTLNRYNEAMIARYGLPKNITDYAQKSQLMNYESVRPMFEAFAVYKSGNPNLNDVPATGVFQWMLNAAWPKFFWQLYDYYLVPGSAFFSAKEANKPLHVIYNYANQNIYLNNDTLSNANHLKIIAKVWDADSRLLTEQHWETSILANKAKSIGLLRGLQKISTSIYFIELILKDENHKILDENTYWLSTTPDKLGIDTDIIQNANYQQLNNLSKASIKVSYQFLNDKKEKKLITILCNDSNKISFFNRLNVKTKKHEIISPIFWSDNFITLFPHQSKTITAHFKQRALQSEKPILTITTINSEVLLTNRKKSLKPKQV